jgi:hypothetical protein
LFSRGSKNFSYTEIDIEIKNICIHLLAIEYSNTLETLIFLIYFSLEAEAEVKTRKKQ